MEDWLFFLVILTVSITLTRLLSSLIFSRRKGTPLPPGPRAPFYFLRLPPSEIESFLLSLVQKLGPIISVKLAIRPAIFIADRTWAHQVLVQHGATFSDRPTSNVASQIFNSGQRNIAVGKYNPRWRVLRRNLTVEILHPSRARMYAPARKWTLSILINQLNAQMDRDGSVVAMESFQFAMFCLLVLMCFGEKLGDAQIREIEEVQKEVLISFNTSQVFNIYPTITKVIFKKRWNSIVSLRKRQENLFMPLIRARKEKNEGGHATFSYVDSLLNLEIPEDGLRNLTEGEIVSLCSEFLGAGTDTTATALQWIMANVVKQPEIQHKLWTEIEQVVGKDSDEVKEEDLQKMRYLKAVVLEGLRRHPPAHLLLPHIGSDDMELNGYHIPKGSPVNVLISEIGCDPLIWSEPLEFRPERFTEGGEGEGVDLTGTKEIRMMPFGAGRRICPGMGLALMHLEYFVANLVNKFEWRELDDEKVDFTEKPEFTVVMRKPLRVQIVPRH